MKEILAFLILFCVTGISEAREIKVVTSFYPAYITALNVAKDIPGVSVSGLTPSDKGCLHDYSLTINDMHRLSDADIFVVNKADREGAEEVFLDIQAMLDLDPSQDTLKPPVLRTVAKTGEGLIELLDTVLNLLNSSDSHRVWQAVRIRDELIGLLEKQLLGLIIQDWEKDGNLEKSVGQIERGETDPYSIVRERLGRLQRYVGEDDLTQKDQPGETPQ